MIQGYETSSSQKERGVGDENKLPNPDISAIFRSRSVSGALLGGVQGDGLAIRKAGGRGLRALVAPDQASTGAAAGQAGVEAAVQLGRIDQELSELPVERVIDAENRGLLPKAIERLLIGQAIDVVDGPGRRPSPVCREKGRKTPRCC